MGGMAQPDDWLRVWRVADLFEFIPAEKVRLTYDSQAGSTLGVEGSRRSTALESWTPSEARSGISCRSAPRTAR
jgi:hypothetical protein